MDLSVCGGMYSTAWAWFCSTKGQASARFKACATTLTAGVESTLRIISRLIVLWLESTTTIGNARGTACQNKAAIRITATAGIHVTKALSQSELCRKRHSSWQAFFRVA